MNEVAGRLFFLCLGVGAGVVGWGIYSKVPSTERWIAIVLSVTGTVFLLLGVIGNRALFKITFEVLSLVAFLASLLVWLR